MKRMNHIRIPLAILTADWHIREDKPICRIDNFWKAQWDKIKYIKDLQQKYSCFVLHAGDLFHHWKPSPRLLSETIKYIPDNFWTIYGNHDLPQHNIELYKKSGIHTLECAEKLGIMEDGHWNIPISGSHPFTINGQKILVLHKMVYQGSKPWPGCTAPLASGLLRKYPEYQLIVTGDNHQSFTETYNDKLLVNPGSLTRQTASQITHKPCIWLWYGGTNLQQVILPYEENVISREHLKIIEQRNTRIDAFISHLDTNWEADISFEENLKKFKDTNSVPNSIMNIIYKAIDS